MSNALRISKDFANRKVTITRDFAAPLPRVWQAYTDAALLDQWWAPKPWQARTKSMDFREGGYWLYAMVGPEGEEHWGRTDFFTIREHDYFTAADGFCDSEGHLNPAMPRTEWHNTFTESAGTTTVTVLMTFATEEDLKTLVEMGFEEGYASALTNLDALLAQSA